MKNLIKSLVLATACSLSFSVYAADIAAGEARFAQTCKNCHGPNGRGMASYPKLAGQPVEYLQDRLRTYRSGEKVGPNSMLMIPMAKGLTDAEIDNLAAFLNQAGN